VIKIKIAKSRFFLSIGTLFFRGNLFILIKFLAEAVLSRPIVIIFPHD